MSNKLYIEGGGDRKGGRALRRALRRAFGTFFENAGLRGHLLQIVAGGDGNRTYKGFCKAHRSAGRGDFVALLVDAEEPVKSGTTGWRHLRERKENKLAQPDGAADDQVHLMVECMEAWFLADRTCLETYFWGGFKTHALPGQSNKVEAIPKDDLIAGLENAARTSEKCKKEKNRTYDKGKDSFKILEMLDPKLVCSASPHARCLIDVLNQKL